MKGITKEQTQAILDRLTALENLLKEKQIKQMKIILDNQEFIQVMNISKRLAQRWRDAEMISYSMVGNKIYYNLTDVHAMLNTYYKKAKVQSSIISIK
jgi:hypothetical protein